MLRVSVTLATICLFALAVSATGQESDSVNEFWPEINVFVQLSDETRIFAMYSATRQDSLGAYADGQAGVFLDFWALPAIRRRLRTHADASRSKLLLFRTGYLFSRPKNNSNSRTEHMWTLEGTGRFQLNGSFLLSDRNRIDLRWVDGDFRWRYRNRLKLERTMKLGRFELTPYGHGEVFYNMDQSQWTRVRYAAGSEWSITRRVVLEGYYLRQNDWGSVPQFVNAAGAALQFYFR